MMPVLTLLTASASCTRATKRGATANLYVPVLPDIILSAYLFEREGVPIFIRCHFQGPWRQGMHLVVLSLLLSGSSVAELIKEFCGGGQRALLRDCALRPSCSSVQMRSGADKAGFPAAEMQSFASLHRKRRPARSLSSQTSQAVNV